MLLTLTRPDNSIEDVPVRFVRDTGLLRRWHIEGAVDERRTIYADHSQGRHYRCRGLLQRLDRREIHGARSRKVRHRENPCQGQGRQGQIHPPAARWQQCAQTGETRRHHRRLAVQLRSCGGDQIPHHRGHERQRQVGYGQRGRAAPAPNGPKSMPTTRAKTPLRPRPTGRSNFRST